MPTGTIHQQLDQLRVKGAFAKFERAIQGCEVLHGFVLRQSTSLVLLHVVREFHLDGYSLVRVKDLDAIHNGREEKFFHKLLRAEGVARDVRVDIQMSLTGMAHALKSLVRPRYLVSVECEVDNDETFYAGEVMGVSRGMAELRTFDALGSWNSKPEDVDAAQITLVSWGTEYLRVFGKYLAASE